MKTAKHLAHFRIDTALVRQLEEIQHEKCLPSMSSTINFMLMEYAHAKGMDTTKESTWQRKPKLNRRTPEYRVWRGMKSRCFNAKTKAYKYYGGRGITIAHHWLFFDHFYADMGPRPSPKHSIDRINNDGNYEPGNCRWATAKEQANNQRRRRRA